MCPQAVCKQAKVHIYQEDTHIFSHSKLNVFFSYLLNSMDGFKVVKLNEVVRQMDMVITCTGKSGYGSLTLIRFLYCVQPLAQMHSGRCPCIQKRTPASELSCEVGRENQYLLIL